MTRHLIPINGWWPPIPEGVTREDFAILERQQRCVWCAERRLASGADPCLGMLAGVRYACCGHGVTPGYVTLNAPRAVMAAVNLGGPSELPKRKWAPLLHLSVR